MKKDYDCVKEVRKIREELSIRYWGNPEILKADMEAIWKKYKKYNWPPVFEDY